MNFVNLDEQWINTNRINFLRKANLGPGIKTEIHFDHGNTLIVNLHIDEVMLILKRAVKVPFGTEA